jgi:hypothetical protein
MRGQGFRLVEGSTNRLTITLSGTREAAERTFDVKIGEYRLGDRTFYANDRDPALPTTLAPSVQAAIGLTNLAEPKPAAGLGDIMLALENVTDAEIEAQFAACCGDLVGMIPYTQQELQFAQQLTLRGEEFIQVELNEITVQTTLEAIRRRTGTASVPSLAVPSLSPKGAGQKIGLVAFSGFELSDIGNFLGLVGLPQALMSQVSKVDVNGGAPLQPGEPGESDVLLGVEVALTTAPGAQVIVYDGTSTGSAVGFQAILNKMINDGVNVISNSFTYCEDQTPPADPQSVDQVLANAAAAGISAFSASGDHGSACSDGTANTIAVPTDSPNVTAVGATSLIVGPGSQYDGEAWLDESTATPPGAQSGFGLSQIFSRPGYQPNALNPSQRRSIPDVVAPAATAHGLTVCEADAGGCPNGVVYGGTSLSTSIWAAVAAVLNAEVGHPLGFLNPLLYPLAGTNDFHTAASMGSDPAHVGLGSPNVGLLELALSNRSAGPVDPSVSSVTVLSGNPYAPFVGTIPDDGSTTAAVVVQLLDSSGDIIPGKTITLSTNPGSLASVSPASGVTSVINGTTTFSVKDSNPEFVTFTATDTSDGGVPLSQQPSVTFVGPPATSAGIIGGPNSVPADGSSAATIVVTLQDSLSRGVPGKVVSLAQGTGQSVISGPNPSVTNSNGQIGFIATDVHSETVNYTATDVTDGNLAVPGSVSVNFTSGSGCAGGSPAAAPGYAVNSFATGFTASTFFFGNIGFGCSGAFGLAFDPSGNLYVAHAPTGNIYKFPPSGGVAGPGTLITSMPLGPGTMGLAFDKNGNLFAARAATTGDFTTGDVIQVNPTTGAIIREVATGLICPFTLSTDPISGDLFTGDGCTGNGSDSTKIWRISNPGGLSPMTTVYANTAGQDNFGITFAPNGTMYVNTRDFLVARITGTNELQPATVTTVPNATWGDLGLATGGMQPNGDAQFLLINSPSGPPRALETFDLTSNPPSDGVPLASAMGALDTKVIGPDGCLYAAAGLAVYRFTGARGNCVFAQKALPPLISLTPTTISPNPAQGTSENFTATFHNASVPAGTPVSLDILGTNLQARETASDANGKASFAYTGIMAGTDNVVATAIVNNATIFSNPVQVTWVPGKDTTFLTLNLGPTSGVTGQPLKVIASLSDVSQNPFTPLSGQTINFTLGNAFCSAVTDQSGTASCSITPGGSGTETLAASFTGTNSLVASNASTVFTVVTPAAACSGPLISARLLSGNATPPAGSSGSWTFQIAICASHNLTNVSAQGGTDNWTMVSSISPSTGAVSVRKENKNNEVLTWTLGNLSTSTGGTLNVTLSGKVSAHCGAVQDLNGPWSALYTLNGAQMQSPHTNQIAITSTCNYSIVPRL